MGDAWDEGSQRSTTTMDARPPTAPLSTSDIAIRIGVAVLTLMAAIVHLSLLFPDPVFILNGLGYLTLLATLYLPISRLVPYRQLVRWTLIGYATLTILAWVAIGERTPLGYSTTAGEVALVALLLIEGRRMRLRGEDGA
jgi:hypothetical protein